MRRSKTVSPFCTLSDPRPWIGHDFARAAIANRPGRRNLIKPKEGRRVAWSGWQARSGNFPLFRFQSGRSRMRAVSATWAAFGSAPRKICTTRAPAAR